MQSVMYLISITFQLLKKHYTSLKGSELHLPLQACLKLQKFAEIVEKATGPQILLFNLYDDWLVRISSGNAFARLVLLFKGEFGRRN